MQKVSRTLQLAGGNLKNHFDRPGNLKNHSTSPARMQATRGLDDDSPIGVCGCDKRKEPDCLMQCACPWCVLLNWERWSTSHVFSQSLVRIPSPPSPRIFPCNCAKRISGASPAYLMRISCQCVLCKCVERCVEDAQKMRRRYVEDAS